MDDVFSQLALEKSQVYMVDGSVYNPFAATVCRYLRF